MIMFSGKLEDVEGMTRFSRRFQNGVEILEKETLRKIKVEDTEHAISSPRLVISDAFSRSKNLISKSRSQLGELDAFLKSIVRPPLNVK
jgi:hypothetical protein